MCDILLKENIAKSQQYFQAYYWRHQDRKHSKESTAFQGLLLDTSRSKQTKWNECFIYKQKKSELRRFSAFSFNIHTYSHSHTHKKEKKKLTKNYMNGIDSASSYRSSIRRIHHSWLFTLAVNRPQSLFGFQTSYNLWVAQVEFYFKIYKDEVCTQWNLSLEKRRSGSIKLRDLHEEVNFSWQSFPSSRKMDPYQTER